MPLYYAVTGKITRKRRLKKKDNPNLIVSLTSYPDRIEKVWIVIETLLDQTYKPDSIKLWLSVDEFSDDREIPKKLKKLKRRGLEIHYCKKNLMPHKKYYYAMSSYPDSTVITVDDDMIYHPKLIENLMNCHKKYPGAICCTLARKIEAHDDRMKPYNEWEYVNENTPPEFGNQMIGAGGTLYPANSLHPDVFNKRMIKQLALKTDDLWLKAMSLKQNTKVASTAGEYKRYFIPLIHKNDTPLMDQNLGNNRNDKNFSKIMSKFGWSPANFNAIPSENFNKGGPDKTSGH